MEGLINFFSHVGGVPHRIWFDNPATIVTKIFEDGKRVLNETFARFKNHYGFTAAFCNVGKGNEKGNVENKVGGYFRRNLLVPVPRFDDLKAFNRQLLEQCDRDMHRPHYKKKSLIADLFEEDRARFYRCRPLNLTPPDWLPSVRTVMRNSPWKKGNTPTPRHLGTHAVHCWSS